MIVSEICETHCKHSTSSQKRRLRRQRLLAARKSLKYSKNNSGCVTSAKDIETTNIVRNNLVLDAVNHTFSDPQNNLVIGKMSTNEDKKTREDVLAAREAKKLAKTKQKSKADVLTEKKDIDSEEALKDVKKQDTAGFIEKSVKNIPDSHSKSKDEVDRAVVSKIEEVKPASGDKGKEEVKSERAAKKAAKQAKKKKDGEGDKEPAGDMTVKDVVETLKDIVSVAKEVQDVTAKVRALNFEPKKTEESEKSKANLKAERRAKQEAQRAAKQASLQQKAVTKSAAETTSKSEASKKIEEVKSPKSKGTEKPKPKSQSVNRVNWFQHLHMQDDKESLKNIPINSNLHPAIVKLGVQLATRVVSGSNARCIALLDAMKKMVRDYTLPAKTEFARGLEAHLAASLQYLWRMRQPAASQTNAVKFFRHHLAQLPNNVDEFDAKKALQEEIDRYIREQIEMAGEAISLAVRNKISNGDNILTYGCSSLIERILIEAWEAGVKFRVVVVGNRVNGGAREMLRRLAARGPCVYADVTALHVVMPTINKVVLGASALLVNGSVVGAVGTAQTALAARERNVPVLVACETHKVSERVQTDAFVYNELGDPDELIDKTDENSPLKDWRSNPNLTPLNLTYDVTPPSLVTAVVTELAILPCTSAPVVLRFKLSEYSV